MSILLLRTRFISDLLQFPSKVLCNNGTRFQSRFSAAQTVYISAMTGNIKYPEARRDESVVDDIFGQKVVDHYRWMEDPDSEETQEFVNKQNDIAKPFLEDNPEWKKINEKLTALWNYPKYGCIMKYGKYYFYAYNSGLQNQSVYYKLSNLSDEPQVFFDPNSLSEDGTVALSMFSFSKDGQYFGYGLSSSGSDWSSIRIRNVETGVDYPEILEKVKFSTITWTKDNKGFFYGCYPTKCGRSDGSETDKNENQKLYYHRVGQSQCDDVLVAEFPNEPSWRCRSDVSDCGKYLILSVVKDCRDNLIFFADLEKNGEITGKVDLTQVIFNFESDYEYVTNTKNEVVFRTNKNAPNYRLIVIDFDSPAESNWKTLIPEHSTDVLDWAYCCNEDKLMLGYIHDVKSVLQVHSLANGKFIREFPLDIGSIIAFHGRKSTSEIFFTFGSFLTPGKVFHYDFANEGQDPVVVRESKINTPDFNPDNYEINQVFYPSKKDGTKIPMFIIRKRTGEKENTPKPCLLYGYGGFNISIQPTFSLNGFMIIDYFDGVMAFPNIRGGGEYGEKWHNGGRLFNKQNVFDDFQSAAEYLIDNKYTTKDKLAIQGGSNGGLLVGACIIQRPDLFGAAIAQVGVMDMLRFHKFTIGHAWMSDYGNPDEKDHFDNLIKYSPLHTVATPKDEEHQYPSTLILTADHDDRVSPLHSLKFAAAIQEKIANCSHQKNPVLLRVYSKAGHGAGKPTTKKIEETTDILTFFQKTLNIEI